MLSNVIDEFLNADQLFAKDDYVYVVNDTIRDEELYYVYNEPIVTHIIDDYLLIENQDNSQFEIVKVINENVAESLFVINDEMSANIMEYLETLD